MPFLPRRKSRTLQAGIFRNFSVFVVFLILAFTLLYYSFIAENLKSRAFDSIARLANTVSNQVDAKLQAMNTLTLNMLFSKSLVSLIYDPEVFDQAGRRFEDRSRMNELMYLIAGVDFPLLQINVVRTNGDFYAFGFENRWSRGGSGLLDQHPNIAEALRRQVRRLLVPAHPDEWGITKRTVVSLFRSFPPGWGLPDEAVLEIQMDYSKFAGLVASTAGGPAPVAPSDVRTWIFDEAGQLVYPYRDASLERPAAALWADLQTRGVQTWSGKGLKSASVLAKTQSEFSGWTVVVEESESKLMEPVFNIGSISLLSSVVVMALALLLSWIVSRTITRPLKKIHESINSLRLETLHSQEPEMLASNIDELENLNSAFEDMHGQLKNSLQEIVASRTLEVQSRLLALQSQMNPHFLFNTILNISIMAEESGAAAVVRACSDLSGMLRYIAKDENKPVPLQLELGHTERYLQLMKVRYAQRLEYRIDIPKAMDEIPIPKLVIQPLVENCVKYGVGTDPAWDIDIVGQVTPAGWTVTVSDRGAGFARNVVEDLFEKTRADPRAAPGLQRDGMGLVNISIRLRLLYGEEAVFLVSNQDAGGAAVTVGGPLNGPPQTEAARE